ncbi:MAG: tetratricopeptide repeat protein [Acidobacteriota bacterium]|nr:tetratricopeptide repeat protein [Acidobacteriota bacterium]
MAKKARKAKRKSAPASARQGPRFSFGGWRLWIPLLLFAAVVAVYLPSVDHEFLYDDYEVILSNAPLRSIQDLGRILTERHFLSLPYYRPVVRSSLLLQRSLHGDEPGPFHLFNAAVAGLIALVVFALLRLPVFGLQPRWALLAAAVFALHPVASSCVYPIASGRETLLPALFVLLALYCFLRPGPWWRVGASVAFALALFGKEQAVVTLAIFALADALGMTSAPPGRSLRRWVVRYWPEAAIGALYFSIRHFLFAGGEYRLGDLGQFALSFLYALQVVTVPYWEMVYEPPARVWFSPWRLAIGLAIAGWVLLWIRRSWPAVRAVTWFWLGWFVLTLLPTANLLDQEAPFAERYVFLAALGPLFLLAWVLSNREKDGRPRLWTGLAVAVLLLMGAQTVTRGAYYRDYEAFCRQWVKTDPQSLNAHNSLAVVLTMDGRLQEAGRHYEEALKIAPANAQARSNLANLRLQQGRLQEAHDLLQEALRLEPDSYAIHNALGAMLLGQGRIEQAIPHFARAISLNSENQQGHANLANALAHQGDTRQAVHHYREALRIHPGLVHVANRLAWILATDPDPALRSGAEAVDLAEHFCRPPNDANPMFLDTLAAAYAETGRFPQALGTATRAASLASSMGQPELVDQIRQRMDAYREHRPVRYSRIQWRTSGPSLRHD